MKPRPKACVWIVEDSPLEADAARRALEPEFDVVLFSDGPSMLERLSGSPPPDIVLLDWHLPALSGIEICQFLRTRAALPELGILIVTGVYSKTDDVVQGLKAGANDYIIKPYVAEELAARVGALVRSTQLRERAVRAEAALRSVLTELPDPLLAIDAERRIQFANNEALRLFAKERTALGAPLDELAPALAALDLTKPLSDVLELGDRMFVPATRALSLDDSGPLTIITLRDVTDTKRQVIARDLFLAMLAHELRNPLAPIMTALELSKVNPAGEAAQRARQIMERQLQRLVRLVDDLLDISRITRGQIELERAPVDIAATLARSVEDTQQLLDAQKHRLVLDVQKEPLVVDGDSVRLEQIFTNLLQNAAKYTAPGGELRVEARRDNGSAVVRVVDNGIGIEAAMLPRVFDMFVQAESSLARSRGGLGIGLTLVKQLVQMHGGDVDVASAGKDRGSTFTVRLPASDAIVVADVERRPAPPSPSLRVLIVDDNEDAAELMSAALGMRGHVVAIATDGNDALASALAFLPGVVLLDIGLPGMDGYAVARQLRADARLKDCFIVGITGYGQPEDRERSRAAGFDEHLVKPVELERLWQVLASRPLA